MDYPYVFIQAVETAEYETGAEVKVQFSPGAVPLPGTDEETVLRLLKEHFQSLSPTVEVRVQRVQVSATDVEV